MHRAVWLLTVACVASVGAAQEFIAITLPTNADRPHFAVRTFRTVTEPTQTPSRPSPDPVLLDGLAPFIAHPVLASQSASASSSPAPFASNDEPDDDDARLELRQQGGLGGGVAAASPTQDSPVHIVYVNNVPSTWTQPFVAVPTQGPSPLPGSIGLGTITGTVGAVRTGEASSDAVRIRGGFGLLAVLGGIGMMAWRLA